MFATLFHGWMLWLTLAAHAASIDWVQQAGMAPIDPPVPASAFSLPDLKSNPHALSDYQGRWVLLTFFATWCGPCNSEMESLEAFSQSMQGKGFDVVAVSTDRSKGPIPAFVRRHGIDFAVLHDARGQAAAAYQAQAIPVSYLIDPAGRLLGVQRGARDWSSFAAIAEHLLADDPWQGQAAPQVADASAPITLPPGVAPPSAELLDPPSTVSVGEALRLVVQVHWQGELRDYMLLPPKVAVPDGLTLSATSADSSAKDGREEIRYTLTLQADEVGSYALDPIELRYTPAGASEPMIAQIQGPTVTVLPITWLGVSPPTLLGLGGGSLALMGLGSFVVRRSGRKRDVQLSGAVRLAELEADLREARALRHNGDAAAFLDALALLFGALDLLPPTDLTELVAQARYGGLPPKGPRLDALERQAKRALADRRRTLELGDPDDDTP